MKIKKHIIIVHDEEILIISFNLSLPSEGFPLYNYKGGCRGI
jgi:hypothetical protein